MKTKPHPSTQAINFAVGPRPPSDLSYTSDTSDPSALFRFVFIRVHSWCQLCSLLVCVHLSTIASLAKVDPWLKNPVLCPHPWFSVRPDSRNAAPSHKRSTSVSST